VEAINAGAAVRREKLIEDTTNYARRLRQHMAWEEYDLFERVDSMLDAEPLDFDVSEFEHIKDPVFELEIEAGFRRLLASLKIPRNLGKQPGTT
jgi:hemerythrin-like domain-containing protein